jgi:hypothetical protein
MDEHIERELRNLAGAHPLARLEAIHQLGQVLRAELDAWVDLAELEQVRAARSMARSVRPSWGDIGVALGGLSHTQAIRRFRDRVE